MWKAALIVGAGSFIGGAARFLVYRAMENVTFVSLPWDTMLVNIIGCLLVGIIIGIFDKGHMSLDMKRFLALGICGGFTTFSTFIHENLMFLSGKRFIQCVLYASLSFALGMIAAYLGHLIVR